MGLGRLAMANVTFQLEEQLADVRSSEIAYRFTAENRGSKTVLLRSLTPRVAEGVTLVDVRDTSERAVRLKHSTLCGELTAILKSYLERLDRAQAPKRPFDIFRTSIQTAPLSTELKVVQDLTSSGAQGVRRTLDFLIDGTMDAETALQTWFKDAENSPEGKLFFAKLAQLKRYDEQMEKEGGSAKVAIATLAPGSAFATTYVFRFTRGRLEAERSTVTIEASYLEDGSDVVGTGAVAASAIISPSPAILSGVAVGSSLLGAVLKAAVSAPAVGSGSSTRANVDWLEAAKHLGEQLTSAVISLQMLGAMVIALVLFNIYEHTELGTRVKMGVGWRSALLIGVLAGAFTERLLEALKVLAGVK
jgi:hypothetical protein